LTQINHGLEARAANSFGDPQFLSFGSICVHLGPSVVFDRM